MSDKQEQCLNCRFSKLDNFGLLRCHQQSPMPTAILANSGPSMTQWANWQLVNNDDWCGEWKERQNT